MISLLVAGFIFYLYAPHLLFKFAAATNYDLITRKEIPQVEEFFAAGLPALFLNIQAVLLARRGLAAQAQLEGVIEAIVEARARRFLLNAPG